MGMRVAVAIICALLALYGIGRMGQGDSVGAVIVLVALLTAILGEKFVPKSGS